MLSTKINVLVIGRGGRESAMVKKVLSSKLVNKVYVAPGNAQTGKIAKNIDIDETKIEELLEFAQDNEIGLTLVGPESSLEKGVVDLFEKNNLKIFGPSKKATKIESSKAYAKEIMTKYNIPTATYKEFSDYKEAIDYSEIISYPHVIKYDGLAAGKGVVICNDKEEMYNEIVKMLKEKKYGNSNVILEEFLDGEEFTLLSFVRGDRVYPLEICRDYKRAYDNDLGLNTGGMGAVCPFSKITKTSKNQAIEILNQTAKAMKLEDNNFCGVLYGGFIETQDGVKVIEYNARFGDPEAELVLQKLQNDLIELVLDILKEKEVQIENDTKQYIGVTLAAKGYPQKYIKDFELSNSLIEGIYHMGTKSSGDKVLSVGGRVLFVTENAKNLKIAKDKVYNKIDMVKNEKLFYRKDIGGFNEK